MQPKTKTLNVRVTADMRNVIRAAARKDGESEGVLVRKILRAYFERRDTEFLHKSALGKSAPRVAAAGAVVPTPAARIRPRTDSQRYPVNPNDAGAMFNEK